VNAYPTQDGRCKLASRLNSIPGKENITGSVVGYWFNTHHQLHEKLKNDELSCSECHKSDEAKKLNLSSEVNLASKGKRFKKNQITCLKNEFLKNNSPLNINYKRIVSKVNKVSGKKATIENVRSWFTGSLQKQNNAKLVKDNVGAGDMIVDTPACHVNKTNPAVDNIHAINSPRCLVKQEATDFPDFDDPEPPPEITPDSDDGSHIDMKDEIETASMSNSSECVRPGSKREHSFIKEEYVIDSGHDTLTTVEMLEPELELGNWYFRTE